MKAQERMKKYYDVHRSDKNFNLGDFLYLKLQPYKQASLAVRINMKLSPKFYGPYEVIEKIGSVACKLKLPNSSKIYLVFHVSLLKEKVGSKIEVQSDLPINSGEKESIILALQAIIDHRERKRIKQILVHWNWLSPADATWEDFNDFQLRFPAIILQDKGVF